MKLNKLIASIILNIIILITSSGNVFASPSSDNSEALNLYNQGIRDGKIQKSTYNYSDFLTAYDQAKDMYLDIDNNTIDFEEYFAQDNNYGAMPDGSSPFANDKSDNDEEIYSPFLSLYTTSRRAKFMGKVKKGDILLVGGAVGHAAIATTDNYILEMPGGYNVVKWLVTGIPNNNSQKTKSQWIDKWCNHSKAKIQIWRPKNKTMSSKVANYADYKFWSSTHSKTKNRYITYKITPSLRSFDPNYCSKLVWQSFYYGSGNYNVIGTWSAGLTYVMPKALINTFNNTYAPYKVATY